MRQLEEGLLWLDLLWGALTLITHQTVSMKAGRMERSKKQVSKELWKSYRHNYCY